MASASPEVRLLGPDDAHVLEHVAPEVFDHPVDPVLADTFVRDPRHHIVVAIDAGTVVGFGSGVHYLHPDKPTEMWINEIGVAPSHQRRGIGRAITQALLEHARSLGCHQAWLLSDRDNEAAMSLYATTGGVEHDHDHCMFEFPLGDRESTQP